MAVYAARVKTLRMSLAAHQSLPSPATALTHLSTFTGGAVLAGDTAQFDEFYHDKTNAIFSSNQASFTNYSTFQADNSAGISNVGNFSYVTFNATYRTLNIFNDLDLAYL